MKADIKPWIYGGGMVKNVDIGKTLTPKIIFLFFYFQI